MKCRHIVKEVQDVTREIGKSLTALSLSQMLRYYQEFRTR